MLDNLLADFVNCLYRMEYIQFNLNEGGNNKCPEEMKTR